VKKNVLIFNVDSKLPNLAIMRLAGWHKARGDDVSVGRCSGVPDLVYASSIFTWSKRERWQVAQLFPNAIVGGTGYANGIKLDQIVGCDAETLKPDYSFWPDYQHSIGFTTRGCRFNCKFCVVPKKEGRPNPVHTIADIWRGDPHPRNILLIDNDFFGQPKESWHARMKELQDGKFKVSFNQGINIRMMTEEAAEGLAQLDFYDDEFKYKRLYTAWDNLKDEARFKKGVETLAAAGVSPKKLMVYMIIGFDPKETMEQVHYRFDEIHKLGAAAFPMVYRNPHGGDDKRPADLNIFYQWAASRLWQMVPWKEYRPWLDYLKKQEVKEQQPSLLT